MSIDICIYKKTLALDLTIQQAGMAIHIMLPLIGYAFSHSDLFICSSTITLHFCFILSLSQLPAAPLHPMDCTDIVIAMARGGQNRIYDYYTRDRATPQMDSFYGGQDSLTAAVAKEENGITTIRWRKMIVGGIVALKATYFICHSRPYIYMCSSLYSYFHDL